MLGVTIPCSMRSRRFLIRFSTSFRDCSKAVKTEFSANSFSISSIALVAMSSMLVGFTRNRTINIFTNDGHFISSGEVLALSNLAFDGFFSLIVARIASIDHSFRHSLRSNACFLAVSSRRVLKTLQGMTVFFCHLDNRRLIVCVIPCQFFAYSPMNESVIVALVTAGAAILSNVILSNKNSREIDHKLETHQAVTDTKLEELTREVREHNNFARRMPVLEEQIKVANHRIDDLENEQRKGA